MPLHGLILQAFNQMSKNQDYDKIIRESVERVIPTIIEKLCGLHPSKLLDLPTSFQRTRERRPDFLKKALEPQGAYIIQIEFQSTNDHEMGFLGVKRMKERVPTRSGCGSKMLFVSFPSE